MNSGFGGSGGGWEGFGRYMQAKTAKLAGQFDQQYERKSDIFAGLTFWMTGRLDGMQAVELKKAVTEHGGVYEQYGFRGVTHIVASNIALGNQQWRKLLNGGVVGRSFLIVTPHWIKDSIMRGARLPEGDYLPACIKPVNAITNYIRDTRELPETSNKSKSSDEWNFEMITSIPRMIRVPIDVSRDVDFATSMVCEELEQFGVLRCQSGYVSRLTSNGLTVHHLSANSNSVYDSLNAILRQTLEASSTDTSRCVASFVPCDTGGLCVYPPAIEVSNILKENENIDSSMKSLISSQNRDVSKIVENVMSTTGVAITAVLIDSCEQMIRGRNLDGARNILFTIRRISVKSNDNNVRIWFNYIYAKFQEAFQLHNDGIPMMGITSIDTLGGDGPSNIS